MSTARIRELNDAYRCHGIGNGGTIYTRSLCDLGVGFKLAALLLRQVLWTSQRMTTLMESMTSELAVTNVSSITVVHSPLMDIGGLMPWSFPWGANTLDVSRCKERDQAHPTAPPVRDAGSVLPLARYAGPTPARIHRAAVERDSTAHTKRLVVAHRPAANQGPLCWTI